MSNLRRRLPSPNALLTFEAAARLLSFTGAAGELNVTQAAVSRQIAALEQRLGCALFVRRPHQVVLTPAGRKLGEAVTQGFALIAGMVEHIAANEARASLVIGATTAFSHFWLLPRLSDFRRRHPDIAIRIVAQDSPIRVESGEVQAVFRFGSGTWSDGKAIRLFGDAVGPVCSPAFAAQMPHGDPIDQCALIELEFPDVVDLGWAAYCRLAGRAAIATAPAVTFSSYLDVVYATLADQGVALGWHRLVAHLLDSGQIVALAPALAVHEAYYLVTQRDSAPSPALARFIAWAMEQSHAGT